MKASLQKNKIFSSLLFSFYLIFFISLVCCFRAITSICIGGILLSSILKNRVEHKSFFHKKDLNLFVISCFVYYVLQWVGLIYTHDIHAAWRDIQLKSALIFVPLAVCNSDYINFTTGKSLLNYLVLILAAASLYCFIISLIHYFHDHHIADLFYHNLVKPLSQHAVYFSVLVFIGLIFLIENAGNKNYLLNKIFHWFLIVYFSFFIFLLSSKLVICFYLLSILYYVILWAKNQKRIQKGILLLVVVATGNSGLLIIVRNPVSNRFTELFKGDMTLFEKDQYNPGIYFNGAQFRLVEWKFVKEILNENNRWWVGTSPGDSQSLLNQKYISSGMYTGDPGRGDHGFLNYNTHNEFLESVLETGIIGGMLFIFIFLALIRLVRKSNNKLVFLFVLLLLAFSLTEAVFETQYCLVIFTFFPLFLMRMKEPEPDPASPFLSNHLANKTD